MHPGGGEWGLCCVCDQWNTHGFVGASFVDQPRLDNIRVVVGAPIPSATAVVHQASRIGICCAKQHHTHSHTHQIKLQEYMHSRCQGCPPLMLLVCWCSPDNTTFGPIQTSKLIAATYHTCVHLFLISKNKTPHHRKYARTCNRAHDGRVKYSGVCICSLSVVLLGANDNYS